MNFSATLEAVLHYVSRHPGATIFLAVWVGLWLLGRFWNPKKGAGRIHRDFKALYSGRHEYRMVNAAEFPWTDLAFYERSERELAALGFRTVGDYDDATVSRVYPKMRTFIRSMVSRDGTVQAGIYHVKMRGWMRLFALFRVVPAHMRTIDLETEMANGAFACTANCLGQDLSSAVAGISRVNAPPETNPAELLAKHLGHVEAMAQTNGSPLAVLRTAEDCHEMQHRIQELKNQAKAAEGFVDMGLFDRCATGMGDSPEVQKTRGHLARLQSQQPVS